MDKNKLKTLKDINKMKEIDVKKIIVELNDLKASATIKTVILNHVEMYNDLVNEYEDGTMRRHDIRMTFGQIMDKLEKLEKLAAKSDSGDGFEDFVKNLKG